MLGIGQLYTGIVFKKSNFPAERDACTERAKANKIIALLTILCVKVL